MSEDKQNLCLGIGGQNYDDTYTIMRRLMFDLNGISEREIKYIQDMADRRGKGSFPFGAFMDHDREARESHCPMYEYCAEFFTDTKHYSMNVYDHRSFIRNIIAGNTSIDIALIMIPADDDFTESITLEDSNPYSSKGRSRLYALLVNLLGIKQIIIGIDKMDSDVGQYKETRFNEIKQKTISMLLDVGWTQEFIDKSVPFLPISGFIGDNLIKKSDNMPWWNGIEVVNPNKEKITIVTLKDALENMVIIFGPKISTDMRVPISGVYKIKSKDKKHLTDVICGRVEQGMIKCGDEVIFIPTHTSAQNCGGKIVSIELHRKDIDYAIAKNGYAFTIKGLSKVNMPKWNDIMIRKGDNSIRGVYSFTCQLRVLENSKKLKIGCMLKVFVRSGRSPAKITEINWKIGNESGYCKMPNPDSLIIDEIATCVFELEKPLVVDSFKNCEELGRVAIYDEQRVVMLGIILSVNLKE